VRNEISWYKLSIGRIELGGLSKADGAGEKKGPPETFCEGPEAGISLFESALTHLKVPILKNKRQ
jgi:hypothetical protein